MSIKRNLATVTFTSLLLALASCGNDSKSSRKVEQEINPVCNNISCMSTIDWKITLQGHIFPENTRLEINGASVLDECMGKQEYKIDRNEAPMSITLESFFVPTSDKVRVKIVDLGWDCRQNNTFLDEEVKFEVVKTSSDREILINL